ncbi:unnamed protein product [Prorocentrum cordatum]|uniref:Uncharacterized protein n=1 Tax=Prorocentrum cordatum TaxID=2364126 RepID=A0ABN9RCD8_9DINO|nr:unnamed protein product [Polarella glacialis]
MRHARACLSGRAVPFVLPPSLGPHIHPTFDACQPPMLPRDFEEEPCRRKLANQAGVHLAVDMYWSGSEALATAVQKVVVNAFNYSRDDEQLRSARTLPRFQTLRQLTVEGDPQRGEVGV